MTNIVLERRDGSNALVLVDTEGDCTDGWVWSGTNEISLCESTCATVEADADTRVTAVFGCTTEELMPE